MTPTEAARRLVALPGWCWPRGMLVEAEDGTMRRLAEHPDDPAQRWWMFTAKQQEGRKLPVLEDDATRGIVLGMLSRRVGAYCWIALDDALLSYWSCLSANTDGGHSPLADGSSWAEAFVRAWEATPPHA